MLGYLLAKSRLLENILSPYLIASQAVPVVAIAPLLVIWFGPGLFSKVLICSLTVFFPVLVNTILGMRAVPDNLRDLMRSMHATGRPDAALFGSPLRHAGVIRRAAHRRHPVGDRRGGGRTGGG
ncbi:MAG: ABC transporter permease [Anaerolineaceae bacterium]